MVIVDEGQELDKEKVNDKPVEQLISMVMQLIKEASNGSKFDRV